MYTVTVLCDDEMSEAAYEALFDRVADAAHALDEQVMCSGGLVDYSDEEDR
jgi:hypothetical protein